MTLLIPILLVSPPPKIVQVLYVNFGMETDPPTTTARIWLKGRDITKKLGQRLPDLNRLVRTGKAGGTFNDQLVRLAVRMSDGDRIYVDKLGVVRLKGKDYTLAECDYGALKKLLPDVW